MSQLRLSTAISAFEIAHLPALPPYHLFNTPDGQTTHTSPADPCPLTQSHHGPLLFSFGLTLPPPGSPPEALTQLCPSGLSL